MTSRSVHTLILAAAMTVFPVVAASQSPSESLYSRAAELYKKGDIDAAIVVAEEILRSEKDGRSVSNASFVVALEYLGQLKLDRLKRTMGELRDPELVQEKAKVLYVQLRKDANDSEEHFQRAIELAGQPTQNVGQAIKLRSKLAWLNYSYIPADTNPPFGFDKDSRDKIELRQRSIYTDRFDQARRLYAEAVEIADGAGNVSGSLSARFNLAEFEVAMGNFEAAIPLYERIIVDAEQTLPRRSPDLASPYNEFLKVLVACGQVEKASDILSKIVFVTGRSAEYPKVLLNLTRRADRSFAPVNSVRVESDAKKLKSEAELAGRSVVARVSAAGGNAPAAALATSVDGRQFYETVAARGIRLQSVLVRVEIDETGKATLAESNSKDRFLKETAEAAARSWSFRPIVIDGKPAKMKGYVEVSVLSN